MMSYKIELTELEYRMLLLLNDGDPDILPSTDEELKAACSVVLKAEALMEELDAIDEINCNLVKWFLKKYENQSSGELS